MQEDRISEYAACAQEAGLHYVTETTPGYERKRWGRGFTYMTEDGSHLHDEAEKARIKALTIPPDWTDVWIAANPDAHVQATGRDAAGRKQYIYHPRWEEVRRRVKFDHLVQFARKLPAIREACDRAMRANEVGRERALAVVITLLDRTLLRIGNEQYLREHGSHGLATLFAEHVEVNTTSVRFEFVGKSEVEHEIVVRDRRLSRQVRRLHETPGERVFTYLEDGKTRRVTADEVNAYLEEICGMECSTKDFRTWGATRRFTEFLLEYGPPEDADERDEMLREAVRQTAQALGNTETVCRDYYLHPDVVDAYDGGRFWPHWEAFEAASQQGAVADEGLSQVERFVVWLAENERGEGD
ncbi:DNA topoisomerase IB [Persicimonas caeni]|uniref:DNA topoisomerase n=1 Tax=Persicimonas caeni TaxID=2292766 RepID=A0A4Y6PPH6_PERCE|nr:DNA topoisomerase IB [Persicimonas caeni]QDG49897.1 DNA topoisomerase IB [Persicimonas caeni]QED31118.1 DNA topoisomerase IB [Persicimonas caeni]